jgi:hypothetical protein
MSSKIKVDNIADQGNNNLINKCGSTITLGASGDTIELASGASQTGFGRTGTVDWQTSIKTGDFTAVSGEGYFVNTASGAVTMTLPSSPSVGDIVAVKDYANTFDTNNLTIARNGQPIAGENINAVISVEGQALLIVYGDATKGWQAVSAATEADLPKPNFITATGGTITTSGNCKIHTFTGPGTFTVTEAASCSADNDISYMIVAGGGGGGGVCGGGGGGAGGFREVKSPTTPYTASPKDGYPSSPNRVTVTAQSYPIVVGGGGTAGQPPNNVPGGNGSNSSALGFTSTGGGGGNSFVPDGPAGSGGSGGGGGGRGGDAGGAGNSPPVTPSQGSSGGNAAPGGSPPSIDAGGGGGGATATGQNATDNNGGDGGAGATTCISASPVAYAGGGGGGAETTSKGCGGTGGGGDGALSGGCATAGTTNRGGGGGGTGSNQTGAGAGGSGIVIIRYRFQ